MRIARIGAIVASTALAATGITISSAAADYSPSNYQNGGFEDPDIGTAAWQTFAPGSTLGVDGWLVGGGGVDLVNATHYPVRSGDQALDLNACEAGSITQTFATVAGHRYSVLYWVNSNAGGNDWNINVTIDGAGPVAGDGHWTGSNSAAHAREDGGWEQWGPPNMLAAGDFMTVTLTSLDTGTCGGVILDDIVVTGHNVAPVAATQAVSTPEDTARTVALGPLTDADGDSVTYAIASQPSNGTLGAVTGNEVTYTPAPNYNNTAAAPDTFTYTASDGMETSGPATVSVEVTPVLDPSSLTQTSSSNGIYTNKKVSVNLHTLLSSSDPACVAGRVVTYTLTGVSTTTGVTGANGISAGKFLGLAPSTPYSGTASVGATDACGAASIAINYSYTQPKK